VTIAHSTTGMQSVKAIAEYHPHAPVMCIFVQERAVFWFLRFPCVRGVW